MKIKNIRLLTTEEDDQTIITEISDKLCNLGWIKCDYTESLDISFSRSGSILRRFVKDSLIFEWKKDTEPQLPTEISEKFSPEVLDNSDSMRIDWTVLK